MARPARPLPSGAQREARAPDLGGASARSRRSRRARIGGGHHENKLERLPRSQLAPGTYRIPGSDPARDAIDRDYGAVFRQFKASETPFEAPKVEPPQEMWEP